MLSGSYKFLGRLHDLWIVLAWTAVITFIMLNTFFHRSCYEFTHGGLTATCQTFTDLGLLFVAALVAGLAISDERIAFTGFLFVHLLASVFTVIAFVLPSALGLQDHPVLSQTIISQTLLMLFNYSFPLAIFSSFLGSIAGLFLQGKLRLA